MLGLIQRFITFFKFNFQTVFFCMNQSEVNKAIQPAVKVELSFVVQLIFRAFRVKNQVFSPNFQVSLTSDTAINNFIVVYCK